LWVGLLLPFFWKASQFKVRNMSRLRHIFLMQALLVRLFRRFEAVNLVQCFGSTE
jgi:hypothetical protein